MTGLASAKDTPTEVEVTTDATGGWVGPDIPGMDNKELDDYISSMRDKHGDAAADLS